MVNASIVQDEFIGLRVTVVKGLNPEIVGITGEVVDESRNTFTIMKDASEKIIVKDTAVFHFVLPDGTIVEVDGKVLVGRPQDRVKKRPRRLW